MADPREVTLVQFTVFDEFGMVVGYDSALLKTNSGPLGDGHYVSVFVCEPGRLNYLRESARADAAEAELAKCKDRCYQLELLLTYLAATE